jgi:LysM repeat protein
MSTPNPLIPQGTFQAQAAKGASNVRLAVATIVAIHIVFFGGLLLQGCKRDTTTAQNSGADTNATASTNLALPAMDTNSMFYGSASSLPPDGNANVAAPAPDTNAFAARAGTQTNTPDALWQANNLGGSQLGTTQSQPGSQTSGTMKEYTVVARDTFDKIARAHRTTLRALRDANPNVDERRIRPGDKLNVPEGSAAVAQSGSASAAPSNGGNGSMTVYTVKPGDNLTRIANAHGVTIKQITQANNMKHSRVNAGQKLKIPARNQTQASTGVTSNVPQNTGF